jgi:hypothetical protein
MSSELKSVLGQAARAAVVCTIGFIAAACDNFSDVGKQDNDRAPPIADVAILNHPFTKDASGNITARVRSGSEVFLTGKDSDGTVAPVLQFDWTVVTQNATASQIKLIRRNESTRSFTAPNVAADTPVQFRLTVVDANGQTAQKDVNVTIVAIPDSNHFLTYDLDARSARFFQLVATTSRDVSASELKTLGNDVEFEIVVSKLIDYTKPFDDGSYLTLGAQRLDGAWLAAYGAGEACDDPRNPEFWVAKPAIDLNEITGVVDPDSTTSSLRPNPAHVNDFELRLRIQITVLSGTLPADVQLEVCAPEIPGADAQHLKWGSAAVLSKAVRASAPTPLDLTLDQIMGDATGPHDTPASAQLYYDTVDPDGTRATFLGWLRETGFVARDRDTFSWADLNTTAAAHATYTNNYDLGFGRDMYARIVQCQPGVNPQLGQPLDVASIGKCDIAAVVINYASLEAATKKLNPVLAVAMEYRAAPKSNGKRFVQFYTFAPDLESGEFRRVRSANLDGRGEKYMPQVCTVCHGGTPGGVTNSAYGSHGDGAVGATFLPWDLDSFLFSDESGPNSDHSYTDQSQRANYTRSAQSEQLKKLNQLAYLTFEDQHITDRDRFALPKQLVEGWYGSADDGAQHRAFTNSTFDGSFTPSSWSETPGSHDLYHEVFARNCRACHIAHMPPPGDADTLCDRMTFVTGTPRTGVPNQLAIACYKQFVAEPALANRLSNGEMPFARLTMDRFWVAGGSDESAGQRLIDHFAGLQPATVITAPSLPRAAFTFQANISSERPDLDMGSSVTMQVDPAKTKFADSVHWRVERCAAPEVSCAEVTTAGADSPKAFFVVPDAGVYNLSLTAVSTDGVAGEPATQPFTVLEQDPSIDVGDLPSTLQLGGTATIAPTLTKLGNGARTDHKYWVNGLQNLKFVAGSPVCSSPDSPCALQESVGLESSVTSAGTGTFRINVIDANGPAVSADRTVALTSGLAPVTSAVTTNPGTPVPINFAEGVTAGAGEQIELQTLSGPSATNALGETAQLSTGSASVLVRTYSPPRRYANYDSAASRHLSEESIQFRLLKRRLADNAVVEQQDFSREVRIQATTSFQTSVIQQVLRRQAAYPSGFSKCTDCHTKGGLASFLRFDRDVDGSDGDLNTDQNIFDNLNGASAVASPRSLINLADPAAGTLLCWPSNECAPTPPGHSGSDRGNSTSVDTGNDLGPLRQWIDEGANNF